MPDSDFEPESDEAEDEEVEADEDQDEDQDGDSMAATALHVAAVPTLQQSTPSVDGGLLSCCLVVFNRRFDAALQLKSLGELMDEEDEIEAQKTTADSQTPPVLVAADGTGAVSINARFD